VKGFLKVGLICVGLVGSVQSFGADISFYYKNFAAADLATLKGCGEKEAYDGYISSLTKALKVSPEINHKKIPQFMKDLQAKIDMEYYLMGYKHRDDYIASGKPDPNSFDTIMDLCPDGVRTALENRVNINEISLKALESRR
jgi:hypothetical protein